MENHRINVACALVVFKIMHPKNVHTPNPCETATLHGTFHMCRRHLEPRAFASVGASTQSITGNNLTRYITAFHELLASYLPCPES